MYTLIIDAFFEMWPLTGVSHPSVSASIHAYTEFRPFHNRASERFFFKTITFCAANSETIALCFRPGFGRKGLFVQALTEVGLGWAEEVASVVGRPKIVASARARPKWVLFGQLAAEKLFGQELTEEFGIRLARPSPSSGCSHSVSSSLSRSSP